MATVKILKTGVSSVSPSYSKFTLSTQLITLNYPVILSHRRSTTVSSETYPLYSFWCSSPSLRAFTKEHARPHVPRALVTELSIKQQNLFLENSPYFKKGFLSSNTPEKNSSLLSGIVLFRARVFCS